MRALPALGAGRNHAETLQDGTSDNETGQPCGRNEASSGDLAAGKEDVSLLPDVPGIFWEIPEGIICDGPLPVCALRAWEETSALLSLRQLRS